MYVKYKKANLNTDMDDQCTILSKFERKELISLLRKHEDIFDGTVCMWNTNPVCNEMK